jgi:hypothetical protein
METLLKILNDYGPWGLILIVMIYILLKGQFTFRYPRSNNKQ